MHGFIGPDLLSEIRLANDIIDVVQWLNVPLKKAGANYRTLCPFHKEKTPSFYVNPQRQSFHCFGCNAGGDVFRFVMMRESLDFPTAARRLAERARIPIPEKFSSSAPQGQDQRDRHYQILNLVREWYHRQLMRSRHAEAARDYLQKRKLDASIAKRHQLGYAPAGWDTLIRWAKSEKFSLKELQEVGLAVASEKKSYDRFRDRLMFPIADEQGRVVGFSGRTLDPQAKEAKYVNSPETAVFKKGRILFGLDRSKRALLEKKMAVVCEGQIDWIRCFESGIPNVVAPQGTAFTDDQAKILKRYVEEVVLCFDADPAGQTATWRNAEALIASGLTVRAATLPNGDDPDSFILKNGGPAFQELLEKAMDIFEHKAFVLAHSLDMRRPRSHHQVVLEISPLLGLVDSEPQRQRIIHNICDILKMDPGSFSTEFRKQRSKLRSKSGSFTENTPPSPTPSDLEQSEILGFGDYLLRLVLTEETAAQMLRGHLQEEWFKHYPLGYILFHVIQHVENKTWKPGWSGIDLELQDDDRERLGRILTHSIPLNRRNMASGIQEAVAGIHRAYLQLKCQELSALLLNPQLKEEERLIFQTQLLDMARQIKHA
jgi:DNA primase